MNLVIVGAIGLLSTIAYKTFKIYSNFRNEAKYNQRMYESILNNFHNRDRKKLHNGMIVDNIFYEDDDVITSRAILGIHGPYNKLMVNEKFRIASKKNHPDKNGDRAVFQALVNARNILLEKI